MAPHSYVYMDEYFQRSSVIAFWDDFTRKLREERGVGSVFMKEACGFGALYRLYHLDSDPRLTGS